MASVTGSGGSMGGAFKDAMDKVSHGRPRTSYTRTSTTAKFHQLFETQRGYEAMQAAGLSVKQKRTLEGWLDGTSQPSKANADAINRAYADMHKGGIPERVKRKGILRIFGSVAYGSDVRDRGAGNTSPLRVDMGKAARHGADWDRIESADNDELEDAVSEELIEKDIDDAYPWGFPGGSYTTTVTY